MCGGRVWISKGALGDITWEWKNGSFLTRAGE